MAKETSSVPVEELLRVIAVENYIPNDMDWADLPTEILTNYVKKMIEQLPSSAADDPLILAGLYKSYNLDAIADQYILQHSLECKKCMESYEEKIKS